MKTYILDQKKSKITWKGKNDEMKNKGELKFANGKFFTELGDIVEGFVGIDFTSLNVADNSALNEQQKKDLVNHLKSEEFLDTKNFPQAEYKIINIVKEAGKTKLKGILNMKDEAYGLNFPVDLDIKERQITAEGDFYLQNINPLLKDEINKDYDGDPINEIELNFKVVAEVQQL